MAFRFADLMISVLPSVEENVIPLRCYVTLTFCPDPFTLYMPRTPFCRLPFPYAANELAILKAELQQTLAQVEAQEEAMKERMRPQTLAEAQVLEEKMVQALEELRRQKEELQKKAAGGQG